METEVIVPILIGLGSIGFVAIIIFYAQRAAKKRASDLLSLSQEKGYSYQSNDKNDEKMYAVQFLSSVHGWKGKNGIQHHLVSGWWSRGDCV